MLLVVTVPLPGFPSLFIEYTLEVDVVVALLLGGVVLYSAAEGLVFVWL